MKAIFKETNEVIEVEPIFDRYLGEFICYQSGDFTKGNVKSYSKYELDFDTEKKNFDPSKFVRGGQLIMAETIDWEERRFEIVKDIVVKGFSTTHPDRWATEINLRSMAELAILEADELIKQLKNK